MCPTAILVGAAVATTAFSSVVGARAQQQAANANAAAIRAQGEAQKQVADYNADATENAADYNAQVAENNALIYDQAADDAIERGAADAAEVRTQVARSNARGRAALASSGIKVDTGTALDLMVQNREFGELNALTVQNNASREAYGYKVEANNARAQAEGIRYTGTLEAGSIRRGGQLQQGSANASAQSVQYAGRVGSRGTLINGAVQVANIGLQYPDLFASKFNAGVKS